MSVVAATEPALDGNALVALAEAVGSDNVVAVMDLILGSVPRLREQLHTAAAAGNLGGLVRVAHQLKSECAHVGAVALSTRLQDLESRAGASRLERSVAEVAHLSVMIDEFLGLLRGARETRLSAAQS